MRVRRLRAHFFHLYSNNYIKAFLLSVLTSSLMIVPFIIKDHGLFTLIDDFNSQQITFSMYMNDSLKNGNVFWSWATDLGSDFIGAYSFYNLGSPFLWISFLFPSSFFPYIVGPLLIFKYGIAGLTSYAYLQRYVSNKSNALIGSLLYSFSGASIINQMFHFQDSISLFPLLLLTLDLLVMEKKIGWFAAVVALSALVNYFFFIGEVIFVLLYFIIRFLLSDFWTYIKSLPRVALEGILGTGISFILLAPSILFIMDNPRTSNFPYGGNAFAFDGSYYLSLIKSFLMPPDLMPYTSAIYSNDYTSKSIYIPLIGISLVTALLFSKKNWITRFIKVLILFSILPVLNSTFTVFNVPSYTRWFYMAALILALASILVLDDRKDVSIVKGIYLTLIFTIGLAIVLYFFPWGINQQGAIFHPKLFLIYLAISLTGLILLYILIRYANNPLSFTKSMLSLVIIFSIITGSIDIYKIQGLKYPPEDTYNLMIRSGLIKLPNNESYRVRNNTTNTNLSLLTNSSSTNSFTSTVNGSIFKFHDLIGVPRTVISFMPTHYYGLNSFLSVKYTITTDRTKNLDLYSKYYNGTNTVYVYKNKDYLPLGFTFNRYITESQLLAVNPDKRHLLLLKALVIPDKNINRVRHYLQPLPKISFDKLDNNDYKKDIKERRKEASTNFIRKRQGFTASLTAKSSKYAFFSVPYSSGWSATVNGKDVSIINSAGFMSIPINSGDNDIRFHYQTPGLLAGTIVSIGSLVTLFAYLIALALLRKNNSSSQRCP